MKHVEEENATALRAPGGAVTLSTIMPLTHAEDCNRALWIAVWMCAALWASPAAAQAPSQNDLVHADLVADVQTIAPGHPFTLGVRFRIENSWHINWINPGDAGLAPSVSWDLPDGFTVGELEWPAPGRHVVGPLVIFGYEHEVMLLARVTPPASLAPGARVRLGASVDWLACQKACIPGSGEVHMELPVADVARPAPESERAIAAARALVPVAPTRWRIAASFTDSRLAISVEPEEPGDAHAPGDVFFFCSDQGVIENAGEQRLIPAGAGFQLEIPRSRMVHALPDRLRGVLVAGNGWGPDGRPRALSVDASLEPR